MDIIINRKEVNVAVSTTNVSPDRIVYYLKIQEIPEDEEGIDKSLDHITVEEVVQKWHQDAEGRQKEIRDKDDC